MQDVIEVVKLDTLFLTTTANNDFLRIEAGAKVYYNLHTVNDAFLCQNSWVIVAKDNDIFLTRDCDLTDEDLDFFAKVRLIEC